MSFYQVAALTVILAVVSAATTSWWITNERTAFEVVTDESLYTSIRNRGYIRAGYAVGAPYFVKDPITGEVSGIFADAMYEIAHGLNLEIRWVEEVGYGQMIEALRSGRVDIIGSGIWINANRASGADFTAPFFYDAVGAYVRYDDDRFDKNLVAIDSPSVRISTIDGEMAAAIAAADFPNASTLSLPQMTDFTQMILNVVNGKADLTFLGLGVARKYQLQNPETIRNITKDKPIRVFPVAIMLPIGEHDLRRAIELATTELYGNGTINSIILRYEEVDGSHYRLAAPYAPLSPNE